MPKTEVKKSINVNLSQRTNETLNGNPNTACKWLDDYVEYSRKWSPRSYDGYHEAVGLWILSTVAQRRIALNIGMMHYPNLYILLVGKTSVDAKSTAAKIATRVLYDCGLSWLLARSDSTPQAFIKSLSTPNTIDKKYIDNDELRKRFSLQGGRGWYFDEFGGKLASIVRNGGAMAEYRTILRRFDDTEDTFTYETISRGVDYVDKPYLALLGCLTPADMRNVASRNNGMWNDGFFARMGFVSRPEPPTEPNLKRWPANENNAIPNNIIVPLMKWNERLGWPEVNYPPITDDDGNETEFCSVEVENKPPKYCSISRRAFDAYYAYHDKLSIEVFNFPPEKEDMAGNYIRFAEKSLRAAMLFASLENDNRIELKHMHRAIEICERWRNGLLAVYEQSNERPITFEDKESKILKRLEKEACTVADINRKTRGLSKIEISKILESLCSLGVVKKNKTQKGTDRYSIADENSRQ